MGAKVSAEDDTTFSESCEFTWNLDKTFFFSEGQSSRITEEKSEIFSKVDGKIEWRLTMECSRQRNASRCWLFLELVRAPDIVLAHDKVSVSFSNSSDKLSSSERNSHYRPEGDRLLVADFLMTRCSDNLKITVEIEAIVSEIFTKLEYHRDPHEDGFEALSASYRSGLFSDAKIFVEGLEIAVHRVILAAASPVFEAMFEHDTLESNTRKIYISDFDYSTIHRLVTFAYNRRIPDFDGLGIQEVISVFEASEKYMVKDLSELACDHLHSRINSNSVIDVLLCADLLAQNHLKHTALEFICCHKDCVIAVRSHSELQKKPHLLTEILLRQSQHRKGTTNSFEET